MAEVTSHNLINEWMIFIVILVYIIYIGKEEKGEVEQRLVRDDEMIRELCTTYDCRKKI